MASPQVNGDVPNSVHSSLTVQHLLNYPLISDGVHTFKANEYGQRSLKFGDAAYQTIVVRVLPFLSKPYQFVSPYVQKADSIGDKTLDRLDEKFPVVKKPTNELYNETKTLILLPYHKGLEGKDHVLQVYQEEYKKNEQAGLFALPKATLTTVFVVSNETLTWLSGFLHAKKTEATQAVNEKINQ